MALWLYVVRECTATERNFGGNDILLYRFIPYNISFRYLRRRAPHPQNRYARTPSKTCWRHHYTSYISTILIFYTPQRFELCQSRGISSLSSQITSYYVIENNTVTLPSPQVTTHASDQLPWTPNNMSLTHWGRDKMAAIFQTTFSNAFSWMKMYEFRLRFHWILFPEFELTISQHSFG